MENLSLILAWINSILWNETWLFVIAGTGLLFTIWSGFSQFKSITHGSRVITGLYDDPNAPGAINHFQALSTALSGTVGLGNISGVALAITLGGPGSIFWMWIVGFLGMSIKLTEVTLSMLYRNTDNENKPHGGPMWVAEKAFKKFKPEFHWLGKTLGILFAFCVMTSAITGGNMFQAWSIADITNQYFDIPGWISGTILAVVVSTVLIGGIKRIASVTSFLVPLMVLIYLIAGSYVLLVNFKEIPTLFMLIISSAFSPTEASGAFIGGTVSSAFLFGMKRAIFSNEAGQGSSPIAHSAVKTNEPVREGVVAGLEPFIDTIIVCTFTALIILSTGIWNRSPDMMFQINPEANKTEFGWSFSETKLETIDWQDGEAVVMLIEGDVNPKTNQNFHKIDGKISKNKNVYSVIWNNYLGKNEPKTINNGFYREYVGATLTAKAFDTVKPGLGKWLITIAAWLFGISTIIAWGYYGEESAIYIAGRDNIISFRIVYCIFIFLATLGHIKTSVDLDNLSGIGLGIIVYANLPICWIFGHQAMRAYKSYIRKV